MFYIYLILRVNLSVGSYYYHPHVTPRETVPERSGGLSDLTEPRMVEMEFGFGTHSLIPKTGFNF